MFFQLSRFESKILSHFLLTKRIFGWIARK